MGGVECNVAISNNNGETWINVDFQDVLPTATDNNPIYAMEYHNNRIYASVLTHGVVYSEDQGVTWHLTDQESLWETDNPENGGQWSYALQSFKGKLYNVSAFGIWEYNEVDDFWTKVDDRWYGSSTLVVDDVLYVIYNASGIPDGVRYTTNLQDWNSMNLPEGSTTSIRQMDYYQGAFFMGHVNDAVFYTLDHGETWTDYRENFPAFSPVPGLDLYGVPMSFVFNDDTLFCGVFSSFEDVGGVHRVALPDEVLGITEVTPSIQPNVYPNPARDFIKFQLPNELKSQESLMIKNLAGRVLHKETLGTQGNNTIEVSTKSWSPGVYIYNIIKGKTKTSGKFLVK